MEFSGRRGRYDKKARQTLMAIKAIESVTQKSKNEVSKRHIDLQAVIKYLPMHGQMPVEPKSTLRAVCLREREIKRYYK